MQSGLNKRTFWQRSFRSVVVRDEAMLLQKLGYIHRNPVRAGLATEPEEYRWSSAAAYAAFLVYEDQGVRRSDWMRVAPR
jgi:hypothetical protein